MNLTIKDHVWTPCFSTYSLFLGLLIISNNLFPTRLQPKYAKHIVHYEYHYHLVICFLLNLRNSMINFYC